MKMTNSDAVEILDDYFKTLHKANGEDTSIDEMTKCIEKIDYLISEGAINNALSVLREEHIIKPRHNAAKIFESQSNHTVINLKGGRQLHTAGIKVNDGQIPIINKHGIDSVIYKNKCITAGVRMFGITTGKTYTITKINLFNNQLWVDTEEGNRTSIDYVKF